MKNRKQWKNILFILCMALFLLPAGYASADAGEAAHDRLADGGYNIYCLSGAYVTVDTYPSLRSVQLAFSSTTHKVFYVENKGNNQITLRIEDPYSSTGYSYVGIEDSIKNGTALKSVDSPYLWNIYSESETDLVFSLRPPTDEKMVANASGQKSEPRTKMILWSYSDTDAPKHAELRFEPVVAAVKTPVASDYSFANMTQTEGSVTPVKIETDSTKSSGAVTVLYDGSPTLPKKAGTYRVTFDVAAAPPAWGEAKGLKGGKLVIAPKPSTAAPVGKVIKMGGMNWRVLDVQDGKALVLSELVLDTKEFQKNASRLNAWADSSLRAYLNGDFYKKTFSKNEKGRIVSTTLVNNINPKYSKTLGTDTKDKVFLLSAEEAERYFVKDKARIAYADRRTPALRYSAVNTMSMNPYQGVYQNYTTWLWWLRTPASPGMSNYEALCVERSGETHTKKISADYVGVRPAMWINVAGGGFKAYQPLKFNKQPKYFTKEEMVQAIAGDIIYEYMGDWVFKFGYGARGPGVNKTQTTVGEDGAMPLGYAHWFYVYRMRCWGVLSLNEFDPFEKVTYGQFKNYLMKTVEWHWEYESAQSGSAIDKAYKSSKNNFLAIAEKRAGISNRKANAKPVKAEIQRLSKEVIYWFDAVGCGNSVRLLEGPKKTKYKVGEKFDTKGVLVVTGPYGKETNLNNKLTYTTSGVTLTQGRLFETTGQKSITISYKGQELMTYPVTVEN